MIAAINALSIKKNTELPLSSLQYLDRFFVRFSGAKWDSGMIL